MLVHKCEWFKLVGFIADPLCFHINLALQSGYLYNQFMLDIFSNTMLVGRRGLTNYLNTKGLFYKRSHFTCLLLRGWPILAVWQGKREKKRRWPSRDLDRGYVGEMDGDEWWMIIANLPSAKSVALFFIIPFFSSFLLLKWIEAPE